MRRLPVPRRNARPGRVRSRLPSAPGWDRSEASQTLVALGLNSSTSLVAGLVLGSITGTFEQFPGLLLMVPAAIGLRGNVYSALGSRLATATHTGTYALRLRPGSVLGDNIFASLSLTVGLALVIAVAAKAVGVAANLPTSDLLTLATISIVGGLGASIVVLAATVGLAQAAVRYQWDLDNLVAPLVSTLGDVLTLPALWAATHVVTHGRVSTMIGWVVVGVTVVVTVLSLAFRAPGIRAILVHSWPVLTVALLLSTLAGLIIEHQLETFTSHPELLVLVPAFVSSAGALGGIAASRYGTAIHMGTLLPRLVPPRAARRDATALAYLAVAVYLLNALGAFVVTTWIDQPGAALGTFVLTTLLAASVAVTLALAVAYYAALAATTIGADPDTFGIPLVTASVDFIGAFSLITTAVIIGLA